MTTPRASTRPRGIIVTVVCPPALRRACAGLARDLSDAAPARARGTLTIAVITDVRMRRLNREFRGVDKATDVLSFPAAAPGAEGMGWAKKERKARVSGAKPRRDNELGEIAVAAGVAARQARAHGHGLGIELRILALHGLLHLLGYDHEQDHGEMRRTEERLRRRVGWPAGLVARAHTA